jgi:hypothetical protein
MSDDDKGVVIWEFTEVLHGGPPRRPAKVIGLWLDDEFVILSERPTEKTVIH